MNETNTPGLSTELIEQFANLSHEQWSGWALWMLHNLYKSYASGESFRARWVRQAGTPYALLSDAEQESDRVEARKWLALLDALYGAKVDQLRVRLAVTQVERDQARDAQVRTAVKAVALSRELDELRTALREAMQTMFAIRSWLIGPDDPSVRPSEPWRDEQIFAQSAVNMINTIDQIIFVQGDLHPLLTGTQEAT